MSCHHVAMAQWNGSCFVWIFWSMCPVYKRQRGYMHSDSALTSVQSAVHWVHGLCGQLTCISSVHWVHGSVHVVLYVTCVPHGVLLVNDTSRTGLGRMENPHVQKFFHQLHSGEVGVVVCYGTRLIKMRYVIYAVGLRCNCTYGELWVAWSKGSKSLWDLQWQNPGPHRCLPFTLWCSHWLGGSCVHCFREHFTQDAAAERVHSRLIESIAPIPWPCYMPYSPKSYYQSGKETSPCSCPPWLVMITKCPIGVTTP